MPWNDNSKPGPWGSPPPPGGSGGSGGGAGGGGPRGPRGPNFGGPGGGGRGRRPGAGGPDLEDLTRQLNDRLRNFFQKPGGGVRPQAVATVAGVLAVLWGLSGIYMVQPDEQAVVSTFGAYSRSEGPGLRFHLPAPIEKVEKVSVTSLARLDVGGTVADPNANESLMLTGDENIVDLGFTVQWRVSNAANYLFRVRDPEDTVRDVAESAMREVIGQTPLQAILTTGRGRVESQAETLMRRTLNSYGSGIEIVEVQIRSAAPPRDVVEAFREVASAGQEAESAINEANAYRNRVVNEAKGDAARTLQESQGYREQAVREAEGDASRFTQIYEQYRRAPAVTRERLYLETMERVLGNSRKVVVDGKNTTAPIILPPDLFRPQTAGRAAPTPTAPDAATSASQGARQ